MSKGKTPRSSAEIAAMVKAAVKTYQIEVTNINNGPAWLGQPTNVNDVWYCPQVFDQGSAATFTEISDPAYPGWVYLVCGDQYLSFTSMVYRDYYLDFSSAASAAWFYFDSDGHMRITAQLTNSVGYLSFWGDGSDGWWFSENDGESGYTKCTVTVHSN